MYIILCNKKVEVGSLEEAVVVALKTIEEKHLTFPDDWAGKYQKSGMVFDGKKWVGSVAYDGGIFTPGYLS